MTVNSLAAQIKKSHQYLDKLTLAASKLKAEHKQEAALQAHILSAKAAKLARTLKASDYLTGAMLTSNPLVKRTVKRRKKR